MNRFIVPWNHTDAGWGGRRHALRLLAVLIYCTLTAPAQNIPQTGDAGASFSTRATLDITCACIGRSRA
jgi:hypothetical protein